MPPHGLSQPKHCKINEQATELEAAADPLPRAACRCLLPAGGGHWLRGSARRARSAAPEGHGSARARVPATRRGMDLVRRLRGRSARLVLRVRRCRWPLRPRRRGRGRGLDRHARHLRHHPADLVWLAASSPLDAPPSRTSGPPMPAPPPTASSTGASTSAIRPGGRAAVLTSCPAPPASSPRLLGAGHDRPRLERR